MVYTYQKRVGIGTNNEAEYQAMIYGLTLCARWTISPLTIYADSSIVIYQITGQWKSKKDTLLALRDQALGLVEELRLYGAVCLQQVPRDFNAMADYLAGMAQLEQHDEERYDPLVFSQSEGNCVVRGYSDLKGLLCSPDIPPVNYLGVGTEERKRAHLRIVGYQTASNRVS
jgi:ribonuclease HI